MEALPDTLDQVSPSLLAHDLCPSTRVRSEQPPRSPSSASKGNYIYVRIRVRLCCYALALEAYGYFTGARRQRGRAKKHLQFGTPGGHFQRRAGLVSDPEPRRETRQTFCSPFLTTSVHSSVLGGGILDLI